MNRTKLEREQLRQWLIKTRKKMKLTQKDLSFETGISINAIRNIEQGQRYGSKETWNEIYKILGDPTIPMNRSGKKIVVKINVHTGVVGSEKEDYIEFYESDFEGMNDEEKENYINEQAYEYMLSMITWNWEIEDKKVN
jgi:transcriptional regulator with XRE-family HTH domain